MMYDLFAEFYENSSDGKPSYEVMMGHHSFSDGELEKEGFIEDPNSDDGYLDYIKDNVNQEDLEKWTHPHFEEEMMNIFLDEEYERIRIKAFEVELIDGKKPPFGVMISRNFVQFYYSEDMAPVFFSDSDKVDEDGKKTCWFRVPLILLKRHFNVMTMMEVKEKLSEMANEKNWSYDELKELFHNEYHPSTVMPDLEDSNYKNIIIDPPYMNYYYDYEDKLECLHAKAMFLLSVGDIDEGKRLLEEAFKMGYLSAGINLAYGYRSGWFGEIDVDAQLKILRKLVRKGHAGAMNDYGYAYSCGCGVKKSVRLAKFWFEKSIKAGNEFAMGNLAYYYLFEDKTKTNIDLGIKYVLKSIELGNEQAMNILGKCYELGIGVEKDGAKAFKWYKEAIEKNAGAFAEYNLANCYYKGIGTDVDLTKAKEWAMLAAQHGYAPNKKLIDGHILVEDWVAVAYQRNVVLFVRKEDLDNPKALGMLVHCDNTMSYSFGLVQKFLKFWMMDILPDDKKKQDYYRLLLLDTCSINCICQMRNDFKRQIEVWNQLEIKWDYAFTEEFHYKS
ncbi:MAG: SEL1-like repeat protein [Bacteroidaceae bacterium]|nr:SEL1-like repeat protein [Bacteroidaceae bacterium]